MTTEMLQAAGVLHKPARYPNPPAGTYAVYFDDVTADGPDGINRIFTHGCMVELYETVPDPEAEAAFEAELDARGLHYEKQARYWLESLRRYQVIYEFSYTIKT